MSYYAYLLVGSIADLVGCGPVLLRAYWGEKRTDLVCRKKPWALKSIGARASERWKTNRARHRKWGKQTRRKGKRGSEEGVLICSWDKQVDPVTLRNEKYHGSYNVTSTLSSLKPCVYHWVGGVACVSLLAPWEADSSLKSIIKFVKFKNSICFNFVSCTNDGKVGIVVWSYSRGWH